MFKTTPLVMCFVVVFCSCGFLLGAEPSKSNPWLVAQSKGYFVHALHQPGRNRTRLLHTSRSDGRMTVLFESHPRTGDVILFGTTDFRVSSDKIAGIVTLENRLFVLRYNREVLYPAREPGPAKARAVKPISTKINHTLFVFNLNSGKRLGAVTFQTKHSERAHPKGNLHDTWGVGPLKVSGKTIHVMGRKFDLDGKEIVPQR
ncbi:MAG: hypothetical protein IH991_06580 [Planctomycetes bacterium]|nr:hypothetical protein [Planctomycetota bacterium]